MIPSRFLTGCLSSAGLLLVACGTTPPPTTAVEPAPVAAPAPVALPNTHVVVVREPAPAPPLAPKPQVLQLNLVEFLLPPERAGALAAEVPSFEALLAEAQAGKIEAVPVALPLKDCTTATFKLVVLVRYPESHSSPQFVEASAPAPEPVAAGAGAGAKHTPPSPPAPAAAGSAERSAPAGAKAYYTPQDFTEKEVGLFLDVTPMILAEHQSVDLDLKWKRTVMDAAVGETVDASGCPNPPRFSVHEVQSRVVVPIGMPVQLATISPTELSKDRRVRVLFVRADRR